MSDGKHDCIDMWMHGSSNSAALRLVYAFSILVALHKFPKIWQIFTTLMTALMLLRHRETEHRVTLPSLLMFST